MENNKTLQQAKRVSFRLRGVPPDSAMAFPLANSNSHMPQLASAKRTPSAIRNPEMSVLITPPKLNRRMTMKPASPQDVASLKKELETERVLHAKQIENIKSFYKGLMNDMRIECAMSVEDAKKQQWCINCSKVAKIYCCWNTSYCDDLCQKKHWASHVYDCERKAN